MSGGEAFRFPSRIGFARWDPCERLSRSRLPQLQTGRPFRRFGRADCAIRLYLSSLPDPAPASELRHTFPIENRPSQGRSRCHTRWDLFVGPLPEEVALRLTCRTGHSIPPGYGGVIRMRIQLMGLAELL